jgi:Cft2 family RNA processing exonuclease
MRLTAISGFLAKGPACFLIEINGRRLLLDCGEGPDARRRPDLSHVGPVDAVLVSHAHADHVGALDLLPAIGNPPIWATPLVAALADAARFAPVHPLPLLGETEIFGIPLRTGRAGHAPGGIWMRIGGPEGLLYTGDVSHEGLLYRVDPPPRARWLVADASYGDYDDPLAQSIAPLDDLAAQGPLLLPAPAGGRGLEMAMHFHAAGHPIALCPAHLMLGERLLALPELIDAPRRSRLAATLAAARPLDAGSAPGGVAIAASANADSGLAVELVPAWLGRATIVFTGHRAEGTASRQLVDTGDARFIRWNVHPRRSDLLAMLDAVQPETILPAFVDAVGVAALLPHLPAGITIADGDNRHRPVIEAA